MRQQERNRRATGHRPPAPIAASLAEHLAPPRPTSQLAALQARIAAHLRAHPALQPAGRTLAESIPGIGDADGGQAAGRSAVAGPVP
jgi:phage protein D